MLKSRASFEIKIKCKKKKRLEVSQSFNRFSSPRWERNFTMNTDQLLTHAQNLLASHGKPDASGYTGDRRIVWIGEQPRFTTDVCTIPAYQDAYIKAIATELNPKHEFILIAGGDSIIKPHRDATFAHPDAISINLGGNACFESEDGDRLLTHGDVTKFNCKRLHAVSKADRDRIVIVIWQRNPKWIEKNYNFGVASC